MEDNSQNELLCLDKNKIIDNSTSTGKEDSTSLSNRQSEDSSGDNSDSFKVPKIGNPVTRNTGTDASSSKKDLNEKSIKKKSLIKDKNKASTLEYEVPTWSKTPGDTRNDMKYKLSEIKGGVVVTEIELIKPYYIFGREDTNDIVMMHPTVSRRHAVLQFGDPSGSGNNFWHLFDMNSTHGTFVNKSQRVHSYTRLEDGFMFKLGCSSRFFLLDKIVPKVSSYEKYRMSIRDNERDDEDEDDDDDDDDYDEDEDLHNKNMVNALKQWFQNEAQDPVFNIEKIGDYVCKIKLPLKDIYGDDSEDYEGIGEGKTKDEAIYEAVGKCWEYLESIGVTPAGIKRSKNWKENDYYDSDEDPFFDRTGDLEKKRIKRMKEDETVNSKKNKSKTPNELHNSLISERENLVQYIKYLEEEIAKKKDYQDEELGEDVVDCRKTFLADLAKKKIELAEIDSRLTNLKNSD